MTGLVQQVRSSEAYQGHLKQRISDEESSHDAGDRHQVVPDSQALRLAGEHPEKDVWQHRKDIPGIAADVADTVQSEACQEALPASRIVLGGSRCLLFHDRAFCDLVRYSRRFFLNFRCRKLSLFCGCFRFFLPDRWFLFLGLILNIMRFRFIHLQPFLFVSREYYGRDLLPLFRVNGIDDGIDRKVSADEFQSSGDSAGESSEGHEIRCGTEPPADTLLDLRRVVHIFSTLLDLTLEGSLASLLRQSEDRVSGSLPQDIIYGRLGDLIPGHLVDHHLLKFRSDRDTLLAKFVLHHLHIILHCL